MNRQRWNRVPASVAVVLSVSSLSAGIDKATITDSGVTGGLLVHLGCGDGRVTATLHVADSFLVNGLDTDPGNVAKARRHIQSLGGFVGRPESQPVPGQRATVDGQMRT